MGRKKDNGGSPVTHAECGAQMEPLTSSVSRIEKALVGDDLQGGLVRKFDSLDNKLGSVLQKHEEEKKALIERAKYSRRMKIAIVTALVGTIGSLLYLGIDFALKHMIP